MSREVDDLHVVVFDVNAYLDVATLLGAPFSWDAFKENCQRHADDPVPHPTDRRIDSLRAFALCESGRFAGNEELQVWSSDHIEDLVLLKLTQPKVAGTAEARGCGWSREDAEAFVSGFLDEFVWSNTSGGSLDNVTIPEASPPLDHEDGCVFATAVHACPDEPTAVRYCVTNDRPFREADPYSSVLVLYAHEWVSLSRRSRRAYAMQNLRPEG